MKKQTIFCLKKIIMVVFLTFLCITSMQAQFDIFDENDECSNPAVFGGFGPLCTLPMSSTTIGATFNRSTDLFSCDSSSLKSSVFFTFNAGVSEVEFNLLRGENINVTVLKNYGENICNPDSTELTNNCFLGLSASCNEWSLDVSKPEVLFTNLIPQTSYLLAFWTDETEQTDFEFCLTRAPANECGDNICYELAENAITCPEDCPPVPTTNECLNATYISRNCNCQMEASTIRATHNINTDMFSCDDSPLKSTVFFRFFSTSPNFEFNLLEGDNINITLLKQAENECNPDSLELTGNCFTNLNTIISDENVPEAYLSDLEYLKEYILAIWTEETEQTDFKFCIREAPAIECGDSICYDLVENPDNCPQDCIGTSIENQSNSFQIFPNPVIDELYINTNLNAIKNANLRIQSIDGKVWYYKNLVKLSESYTIELSNLPQGMYCLQIYADQINHLQKFLKL